MNIFIYSITTHFIPNNKCGDNFCFKGQEINHVGTLGDFVVPHWKESLPLSTL